MKLLLVDDHALFREGLSQVLKALGTDTFVLEAGSADEAMLIAGEHHDIDLVLLDLNLHGSSGFEVLQKLIEQDPALPIIIISASDSRQDMQKAIDSGASGFINKGSNSSVMLNAIRLVLAGEIYIPAGLHNSHPDAPGQAEQEPSQSLTQRQKDVLRLMMAGHPNKIIASELNISEATVKMHSTAIFRALDVNNRTQAVNRANELKQTLGIEA